VRGGRRAVHAERSQPGRLFERRLVLAPEAEPGAMCERLAGLEPLQSDPAVLYEALLAADEVDEVFVSETAFVDIVRRLSGT